MTSRSITAAAMREAIAAAKTGLRVEFRPDGTLILEPAAKPRDDSDELDLIRMRPR